MFRQRLFRLLLCLAWAASALAQTAAAPAAGNQQVDPFATPAPPPQPAAPATRPPPPPAQAPAPAPGGAQPLPAGLRALLIRNNGQGLLGSADPNALSMAVANVKPVRIGGQDYLAEVSATTIRLYAGPKGRLVWEGSLGSPTPVSAPLDLSQLKFVPPLSAGVSPGLKSATAAAPSAAPAVTRVSE